MAKQARQRSRGKKDGDDSFDKDKDKNEKNTAQQSQPEPESEHESDIHVINRAVYRFNGQGYLDPKRHSHIWVMDVPTTSDELTTPTQLTSGNFDERELNWSHDGSKIYFVTSHVDEPYYEAPTSEIYFVPSAGGSVQKVASINMGVGDFALSRDDRRATFHAETNQPVRSYTQTDLWVMDLGANAQPKNLTANYDFDMGSGVFGDNAAPRGSGRGGVVAKDAGAHVKVIVRRQVLRLRIRAQVHHPQIGLRVRPHRLVRLSMERRPTIVAAECEITNAHVDTRDLLHTAAGRRHEVDLAGGRFVIGFVHMRCDEVDL